MAKKQASKKSKSVRRRAASTRDGTEVVKTSGAREAAEAPDERTRHQRNPRYARSGWEVQIHQAPPYL